MTFSHSIKQPQNRRKSKVADDAKTRMDAVKSDLFAFAAFLKADPKKGEAFLIKKGALEEGAKNHLDAVVKWLNEEHTMLDLPLTAKSVRGYINAKRQAVKKRNAELAAAAKAGELDSWDEVKIDELFPTITNNGTRIAAKSKKQKAKELLDEKKALRKRMLQFST